MLFIYLFNNMFRSGAAGMNTFLFFKFLGDVTSSGDHVEGPQHCLQQLLLIQYVQSNT